MKTHPREKLVQEAEKTIKLAIVEATKGLTVWEQVSVLSRVFGDELAIIAKYQIRHERHGDYDTPGGLA